MCVSSTCLSNKILLNPVKSTHKKGIAGGILIYRTGEIFMSGGIVRRLTDKACKAFVAQKAHGRKLSDGGGLYLLITPAGGAVWRIKYRICFFVVIALNHKCILT